MLTGHVDVIGSRCLQGENGRLPEAVSKERSDDATRFLKQGPSAKRTFYDGQGKVLGQPS